MADEVWFVLGDNLIRARTAYIEALWRYKPRAWRIDMWGYCIENAPLLEEQIDYYGKCSLLNGHVPQGGLPGALEATIADELGLP